jgi:hypothetical protein
VKILVLVTATILGLSVLSLPLAMRGSADSPSTASGPGATRQPADLYFVTQTSLAYEVANGSDSDLKTFAQQTLPKIQDHLERALKLHK